MSRVFKASRPGYINADDVQRQIEYNPSFVYISRKSDSGDGVNTPRGNPQVIASFQCLIAIHERLSKGMIDITEPFGQEAKSVYVMITKQGQDINGNNITFNEGDFVYDGTYSYLVDVVTSFYFKNEAILEYLQ